MEAASLLGGVRQARYSVQRDFANKRVFCEPLQKSNKKGFQSNRNQYFKPNTTFSLKSVIILLNKQSLCNYSKL